MLYNSSAGAPDLVTIESLSIKWLGGLWIRARNSRPLVVNLGNLRIVDAWALKRARAENGRRPNHSKNKTVEEIWSLYSSSVVRILG